MVDETPQASLRAEDIAGLRELVVEILREERTAYAPTMPVDMEELRRSPAGSVLRVEAKLDQAQSDLGDLQHDVQDLQVGLRHLTREVVDLRADVKGLNTEVQKLQHLSQEVGDLRTDVKGLSTEVQGLHANFERLENRFDRLEETTRADFQRLEETTRAEFHTIRGDLQRLEETTRADFQRLEETTRAEFHTIRSDFQRLEDRLQQHEKNTLRMFFVVILVVLAVNGDKIVRFLSLLIP